MICQICLVDLPVITRVIFQFASGKRLPQGRTIKTWTTYQSPLISLHHYEWITTNYYQPYTIVKLLRKTILIYSIFYSYHDQPLAITKHWSATYRSSHCLCHPPPRSLPTAAAPPPSGHSALPRAARRSRPRRAPWGGAGPGAAAPGRSSPGERLGKWQQKTWEKMKSVEKWAVFKMLSEIRIAIWHDFAIFVVYSFCWRGCKQWWMQAKDVKHGDLASENCDLSNE